MAEIDYMRWTAAKILKAEFKNNLAIVRQKGLTQQEFREFVISKNPEYDSPEGADKIRNAWYNVAADVLLTRLLADFINANH